MSTLSSANVTDVNLVLKECTHMRLCLNMLIFMHNLGNWLTVNTGVGGHVDLIYHCHLPILTDIMEAKSDQNVQYFMSSTTVILNYITVR